MKNTFLISVLLALNTILIGCQPTGAPTTQPTLPTVTTQAEAGFDAAVNAVYLGVISGVIPKPEYWRDIDPIVASGQAALASMRAHANANDATGVQAASDAVLAATAQLQPFVDRAKKGK